MKQYPEYKPSGIDWIGDIPSHWQVIRIKFAYKFQTGATPPTKIARFFEGDLPWATIADLKQKTICETETYLTKEGVSVCSMDISPKDSLLYSFKLSVGTVAFCGVDMFTNEAIATFLKGKNSLRYLYYTAPLYIIYNANYNIYGAPLLRQQLIKDAITILPPLAEQEAIADFLDKKCGEIDSLIRKQQRRIELLDELRQTTITNAVTRGLNADTPLRSSGIDWLGQIPKHWNVKRMRFLVKMTTGNKDTVNRDDSGLYPFYVRSPHIERINTYSFDGEAVLMAGDGVGAGKVIHYANGKFDFHQRVYCFYDFKDIEPYWLYLYLISNFRYKIEEGGAKNTVDSVRQPWLKDFPIAFPNFEEQKEIISFVKSECFKIDKQIARIKREIELLEEYKQSVVAEVVTGKRRVCDTETPSIVYDTEPQYTASIAAEP